MAKERTIKFTIRQDGTIFEEVINGENAECIKTVSEKYGGLAENPPKDLNDADQKRVLAAVQKGLSCSMKSAAKGIKDKLMGK